jgi:hypothetical protein
LANPLTQGDGAEHAQPESAEPVNGSSDPATTARRRPLSYERRFADRTDSQRAKAVSDGNKGPDRLLQNYGPEGVRLFSAAAFDYFVGTVTAMVAVLLFALTLLAHAGLALKVTAYGLVAIGCSPLVLAMIRSGQGSHAGKAYRGGRPFHYRWSD